MDTFLIFFFNGVFLEFGDELFCMILAEPTGFGSFQSCHRAAARAIAFGAENRTFLALAGGIVGYAFAPTYYVYMSLNAPPKTAGETFKVLFLLEAFEGAASVVGQLATDGNLGDALIPLLFILPIGFAKGLIFAFIFEWRRSEFFKIQVILGLGVVLAILYHMAGAGDLIQRDAPQNRLNSQPVESQNYGSPIHVRYLCIHNMSERSILVAVLDPKVLDHFDERTLAPGQWDVVGIFASEKPENGVLRVEADIFPVSRGYSSDFVRLIVARQFSMIARDMDEFTRTFQDNIDCKTIRLNAVRLQGGRYTLEYMNE